MTDDLPFAGLKVIDCASFIAGPAAATVLADLGADVIKIEPPGAGDPYRAFSAMPGQPLSGHHHGWLMDGRCRRSHSTPASSTPPSPPMAKPAPKPKKPASTPPPTGPAPA